MIIGQFSVLILGLTIKTGISPMPSSRQAQKAVLALIPSSISRPVYELGSGWGQMTLAISREFQDVRVIGLECSWVPWGVSWVLGRLLGGRNLEFQRKNFQAVDLQEAQVIVCYLYPGAMSRLAERLPKELKPGTVVISNTFRMPGWEPEKVVQLNDLHRTSIYRYIVA